METIDYNYSRNSMLMMLYDFFKSSKMLILNFIFLLSVIEFVDNEIIVRIVWIIFLLSCIQRVFSIFDSWYRLKYKVNNDGISIIEGVINKNAIKITFKNIQKIELSATIFQKFLKQTTVTIKTNIMGDNSEIKLEMLSDSIAKSIKDIFEKNKGEISKVKNHSESTLNYADTFEDGVVYHLGMKELFIYSLLTLKPLLIVPFTIAIYFEINRHIDFNYHFYNLIGELDFSFNSFVGISFVIIISMSILYGFLWIYLRYKDFKVYQNNNGLSFSQGLTEEKERNLLKEDINAIAIKRNLMMMIFKKARIHTIISGYSANMFQDSNKEQDAIFPYVSQSKINDYIHILSPDMVIEELKKTKKLLSLDRAYFIFICTLSIAICAWLFFFFITPVAVLLAMIVLFITKKLLSNRYNTITLNKLNSFITIHKGLLSNEIYIIKKESIEQVVVQQSFIQTKLNIGSLVIYFRDNPVKRIKIYHIPLIEILNFNQWWK